MPVSLDAIPVELLSAKDNDSAQGPTAEGAVGVSAGSKGDSEASAASRDFNSKILSYVLGWRNKLRSARQDKLNLWNECWQLYRGLEDFTNKEDWQSKIVLPKAFSSVKQATSVIKRLLSTSKDPFNVESVNPDDSVMSIRAGQMTDLVKVLLEQARYRDEFAEALECSFIIGVGVMKVWWGLVPRVQTKVITEQVPMQMQMGMGGMGLSPEAASLAGQAPGADLLLGDPSSRDLTGILGQSGYELPQQNNALYPTQLPNEALDPRGWGAGPGAVAPPTPMQTVRKIIQEEILEGRLQVRAVDPYNFYWLPGSKLNRWAGTIEEIEIPRWELLELASLGVIDKAQLDSLHAMAIDEQQKQSTLRFGERPQATRNGPNEDSGTVKITEYYGPLVIDGSLVEKHAHVLIANDNVLLLPNGYQRNQFWQRKAPYVGFSPLALPFRTEGVGLVEMVRKIDKALSQLANLSMDTLMFRLLPVFEVNLEAYENPEDFETGMHPGKIFRRNGTYQGQDGLNPIEFQDISGGTIQVAAQLDRAHQEGALVSEIQESLPRFRGVQSATEVQTKAANQESFFGAMATDIEQQALEPLVEMASDLALQFLDTANDPRIESILGLGAGTLRGLSREEVFEMVQGDYKIKVTGISGQLAKAEMLQNLVQFMNLIGQNPEAWLPYLNQDALLRRILEAFRPAIHDIEQIIADPETAMANKAAMSNEKITPEILRQLVDMTKMAQEQQNQQAQMAMQQQQQAADMASQQQEMAMRAAEMRHAERLADKQASASQVAKPSQPSQE